MPILIAGLGLFPGVHSVRLFATANLASGVAWVAFAFFLHGPLIGLRPFG